MSNAAIALRLMAAVYGVVAVMVAYVAIAFAVHYLLGLPGLIVWLALLPAIAIGLIGLMVEIEERGRW